MELKYDIPRSELVRFVPSGTTRLLDIGCAGGRYGAELAETIPGIDLWGVEPDEECSRQAQAHFGTVIQGTFPESADQLPRGTFEVVTFNDVLEHMVEPASALEAVKPLLRPAGKVIASIPNVRHRSVIWPLLRGGDWKYEKYGLLDRTHLRFFTRKTTRELFEQNGWRIVSCEGINACWHWADNRERRLVRWLRKLSFNRLDEFFFVQYVITAEPR
jgi:2-polyprenyl-3-methyl-5-hydroxy-6-metoxy-1,4-benzoquinol methylase